MTQLSSGKIYKIGVNYVFMTPDIYEIECTFKFHEHYQKRFNKNISIIASMNNKNEFKELMYEFHSKQSPLLEEITWKEIKKLPYTSNEKGIIYHSKIQKKIY